MIETRHLKNVVIFIQKFQVHRVRHKIILAFISEETLNKAFKFAENHT